MITIENNIAHIEGTPKQLCLELTHLLVHIKKTLEKEYNMNEEQSMCIINECAKIAYMSDEYRVEYLNDFKKDENT